MKSLRLTAALAFGLLASSASSSFAQVRVEVSVPLPTIRFTAPPPLVVVAPGVQVVPDYPEEVFFVQGYYWHRAGPRWYRARDYRGGWVLAGAPVVPAAIVRLPPGRYKKYARQERREERREERHDDHGRGHGHDKR